MTINQENQPTLKGTQCLILDVRGLKAVNILIDPQPERRLKGHRQARRSSRRLPGRMPGSSHCSIDHKFDHCNPIGVDRFLTKLDSLKVVDVRVQGWDILWRYFPDRPSRGLRVSTTDVGMAWSLRCRLLGRVERALSDVTINANQCLFAVRALPTADVIIRDCKNLRGNFAMLPLAVPDESSFVGQGGLAGRAWMRRGFFSRCCILCMYQHISLYQQSHQNSTI